MFWHRKDKKRVGQRKRIELSRYNLIFLVATLICFFEPQMFKEGASLELDQIDFIYKILKLMFSIGTLLLYFKKVKPSKLFWMMSLFQLVGLVSTLINSGDTSRFIGPALTTLCIISSTELLLKSGRFFEAIKPVLWYFRLIAVINVITLPLIFSLQESGNNIPFFLGIDNRWVFTYFPWILLEFISSIYHNGKISIFAKMAFVFEELTLLCMGSAAAFFVQILWVVLFWEKICQKICRTILPFIIVLCADFSVTFLGAQNLFKNFIGLIGKDVTISGRTLIWRKVLSDTTSQNILLGGGMQSIEHDKLYFASSANYQHRFLYVPHAHNSIFTILYRFGIVNVVLYLLMLLIAFRELVKNNKYLCHVVFVSLIISLCLAIFDTFDCAGFFMALALGCSADILSSYKVERRQVGASK